MPEKQLELPLQEACGEGCACKKEQPKPLECKIDPQHILKMSHKDKKTGKTKTTDFVMYDGLKKLTDEMFFIVSFEVDITQFPSPENSHMCVTCATLIAKRRMDDGSLGDDQMFSDIGDASYDINGSINYMIKPHYIRMASTRAKGRVLREATNVGMCMAEELGEDIEPDSPSNEKAKAKTPATSQNKPAPNRGESVSKEEAGDIVAKRAEEMYMELRDAYADMPKLIEDTCSDLGIAVKNIRGNAEKVYSGVIRKMHALYAEYDDGIKKGIKKIMKDTGIKGEYTDIKKLHTLKNVLQAQIKNDKIDVE